MCWAFAQNERIHAVAALPVEKEKIASIAQLATGVVFETTKPIGKGTGLGLSLSYGIVQKHHGRIEVSSKIGEGTTFRVVVPMRQADTQAKAA